MTLALKADDVYNLMQIRGFGPAAHGYQAHIPTDLAEKRRRLG
jgi:hypothetical protein